MSEVLPTAQLGDLATITMGQSPDSATVNGAGGGLPFLQGCAEFGARFPQPRFHCSPPLRVAKSGSILISVRAPVGTTNRADQDYCIGRGLGAVLAKPGIADDVFLLHAIEANLEFLHRRSQGSTFLAIGSKELSSLPVPAPVFAVQRRIAKILSTLDEAIEQTEALIAKHQQIRAGLMHDLFTRGVTPDGHLRPTREQAPDLYKESPLGWIPKEWEVERLGDILRRCGGYLQTGPFGSQLHAHEYQADGVPVVMPQDINDGLVGTEQIARIHEGRAEELSRHRMRLGDIVIARRGDLSRAAAISEAEQGWVCGTGCFLLRLGQSALRPDYAAYVYRQDFLQRQIAATAVGTTMPSLNNSVMEALLFPFCGEDEQLRIVERLKGAEQEIHALTEGLFANRQIKHGLMHDLLTGHVSVKLSEKRDTRG